MVSSELEYLGVEMIHYDVCDDGSALDLKDIPSYRGYTSLPFDVHLTVVQPDNYIEQLTELNVEYCSIHVETEFNHKAFRKLRNDTGCQIGLAINIETSIKTLFPHVSLADFILFMAAEPGKSGGQFGDSILNKIKEFRNLYPEVPIHVDGGINHYSAAVLRDIGVDVLVSGSYILNSTYKPIIQTSQLLGRNLLLKVSDLIENQENFPVIQKNVLLREAIKEITRGERGATCVVNEEQQLAGIITDFDLRKLFFRKDNIYQLRASEIMNPKPITIHVNSTLLKAVRTMENRSKSISLLPVIDDDNTCLGLIWFQELLRAKIL